MRASPPLHAPSGPPRAFRPSRFLLLGGIAALAVLLKPHAAFADPHAVFYTTKGQEQVFYNVLAALNQADFVEPPGTPTVPPSPTPFPEFDGNPDVDAVQLPRIRVRAVTPDDGDVYYRTRVLELARVVRARSELTRLACGIWRYADPAEFRQHRECQDTGRP